MSKEQIMEFPDTFEKFAKEYGFKDDKEVYTYGSDLIPIFRVKQWLEHDNKLRTVETDTAYECGKHANKWIPISERMPKKYGEYLITWTTSSSKKPFISICECEETLVYDHEHNRFNVEWLFDDYIKGYPDIEVIAWMPLPEPYKAEREVKE